MNNYEKKKEEIIAIAQKTFGKKFINNLIDMTKSKDNEKSFKIRQYTNTKGTFYSNKN